MKVLICGDRDWNDFKTIREFIKKLMLKNKELTIIEGGEDTFTLKECKNAVKDWLDQKKQDYIKQLDLGADYWLYTHRKRVIDDLLKELEL
jgi:ABC-type sugar transport system substrate-binding protein